MSNQEEQEKEWYDKVQAERADDAKEEKEAAADGGELSDIDSIIDKQPTGGSDAITDQTTSTPGPEDPNEDF